MSTIDRLHRPLFDFDFNYEHEPVPTQPEREPPIFADGTGELNLVDLRTTLAVGGDEGDPPPCSKHHVLLVEDVATIAHDLKSPLATIALEVSTIQESLTEPGTFDVRRSLARVERNITCIDHMVGDLLDLASIDAKQLRIRRVPLDLTVLIVELVDRVIADRDRERIHLDVGASIMLLADGRRIERVVTNLVQNAFKYAPRRSPVTVRLEALGDRARVSVIDAGPGLTPEEARFVFDKFRRTRAAGLAEGTGLGLYVSSKIIEEHGGRIGVASGVGKGAGFYFDLPFGLER